MLPSLFPNKFTMADEIPPEAGAFELTFNKLTQIFLVLLTQLSVQLSIPSSLPSPFMAMDSNFCMPHTPGKYLINVCTSYRRNITFDIIVCRTSTMVRVNSVVLGAEIFSSVCIWCELW